MSNPNPCRMLDLILPNPLESPPIRVRVRVRVRNPLESPLESKTPVE